MRDRETNPDDELTELLARTLPQYPAPLALKRALGVKIDEAARHSARRRSWLRPAFAIPALAAAALLLVGPLAYDRAILAPARAHERLVTEAVNDHVRVTLQPLGVE